MHRFVVLFIVLGLSGQVRAADASQKQELLWQKVVWDVLEIVRGMDGVMGVAVIDLSGDRRLFLNADEIYSTASSIKIAVLAELYRQDQRAAGGASGMARLSDTYTFREADLVGGSYIMGGLTPGVTRVTNRDLATFMIAVSDNAAANVLIDRLGFDNINGMLDSLGLTHTRLRRKMMDLEAAKAGRENTSTPREMASLLEQIYRGKLVDEVRTEDFFKVLSTPKDSEIPRGLPEDLVIANKPGSLPGVRTDTGIVFLKDRPFVISVMTAYVGDERAAELAITRTAEIAYKYFAIVAASSPYGRGL